MAPADAFTTNRLKHVLPLPSLPIIQGVVVTMAPLFEGKRNDNIINLLHSLLRGDKTQQEIEATLMKGGININDHPDFALFTGEKRTEQFSACASYIASSVLIEPNLAEFLEPTGTKDETNNTVEYKINQEKLTQALSTKLAVAITTADFFALIARELETKPNLQLDAYRAEAGRLFSILAPNYLERLQHHYLTNLTFNVPQMQNGLFTFNSSNGYLFSFDQRGLSLKLSGINWYGDGQLLGKDYFVDVAYFAESINDKFS